MSMETARTLLEHLSRNRLLKRRVEVNGNKIPLFVSPDAQLKFLKSGVKAFDQDLICIAEKYLSPDSNVWDIGANVGLFTFAAASVAVGGTVISVEADTWIAGLLRRTASLKEYSKSRICVVPAAVSRENSVASFMIAKRGRASNSLEATSDSRSQMGGYREKQFVPTLTMDTLLQSFPSPNFVKMDIEGAEYMALQGAQKVINEVRPTFYIEVGNEVASQVCDLFREANYVACDRKGEPLTGKTDFNMLFVPEEKNGLLAA